MCSSDLEILGKVDKYSAEVGGVESSTSPSAAPSNAVLSGTGTPIQTGSGGFLTTTQQETKKEEKKEEPKGSGDDAVKYPPNAGQAKVTSMYGFRTQPAGPKKGEKIFHGGIDYAGVPKGTPIQLLASAKILLARDVNGYGNMIDALVNGEVLRFAHLDSMKVKQGDEIPAKTIIGTCNNQGTCNNTICYCNNNYTGNDCSINKNIPPILNSINSEGNISNLACSTNCNNKILIDGNNFWLSDNISCNFNNTYITNAYTGIQYKWDGNSWSKSFEGIYHNGDWRLIL